MPELHVPRHAAGALLAALLSSAPLAAQTTPAAPVRLPPPPSASAATVSTAPAAGQRALSLDDALTLAEGSSDQIAVARAGVMRATGQRLQATSQRLPQLNGTASYSRALASQFSSLAGSKSDTTTQTGPTNCHKFVPNPALTVQERLDSLEHAVDCATNSSPFSSLGSLPFGRANTWSLGLALSQNVFSGGRISGQVQSATAGRTAAEIQLASTRAQLVLDVAQAYYNAALADRLVQIAEATLEQARTTLEQARLARQVGNAPEFDLLNAQVTYQNQLPVVIQRRADRDLAYTQLRLLLGLPADAPLALSTPLNDAAPVPVARFASNPNALGDTTTGNRAPVRQAEQQVRVQEGLLKVARAEQLPSLSVVSNYGKVAYPTGALPAPNSFLTNWTVGAQMSVPIFTGGRLKGDRMVAESNVIQARAQLGLTRWQAELDTRTALRRLDEARATWQASQGTVEQATRAYQIAEVRYREGMSTQVELSNVRIQLQQAEANRAQAARDLQVAQLRMALLPDLPISTAAASASQAAATAQQLQQQQQQQSQQNQSFSQQGQTSTQGAAGGAQIPGVTP
jgi:outer membrane protein TolC